VPAYRRNVPRRVGGSNTRHINLDAAKTRARVQVSVQTLAVRRRLTRLMVDPQGSNVGPARHNPDCEVPRVNSVDSAPCKT
jgi:hypothetical protein